MQVAGHPNCCGYTPITVGSYGSDPDADIQKLIGIVQGQSDDPKAKDNRIFEIILNEDQLHAKPKLLAVMAALGFVWVCRQHNGRYNDSWINQFIRVQRTGKAYKKPNVAWTGLSLVETILDYDVKPLTFKPREIPNPFSKSPQMFDVAAVMAPKVRA